MPGPSDRERLLKLIDGAPTPEGAPSPVTPALSPSPMAQAVAPLVRPQTTFHIRERAAEVYDRVRAAVAAPESDRRFSLLTATLVLILGFSVLAGIDRWRTWKVTREVAVVAEDEAAAIRGSLGLKLVGIDWSAVPVALVEDTVTGKTYFIRQGDSIKGARAQLIFKDKIILNTAKGRVALR